MANIKGFAIRGLIRYAKDRDPQSVEPLIAEIPEKYRSVFDKPITISQLYPYPAFALLLRGVDRRFGRGDLSLCPAIGEFAAARDIGGVFKAALNMFGPRVLLQRANIFWSKYCDTGKLVAVDVQENSFLQRLEGFPDIDEAQCRLLDGFMRRFGELVTGSPEIRIRHTTCVHHGGIWCEWEGSWVEAGNQTGSV